MIDLTIRKQKTTTRYQVRTADVRKILLKNKIKRPTLNNFIILHGASQIWGSTIF